MKTKFLLLMVLMLISGSVRGEEAFKGVPFNGIVTDVVGNPIKGVRIWIYKDLVSRSDKDGKFGLTNVQPGDTIHLRYKKINYDLVATNIKGIRIRLGDEMKSEEDEEIAEVGYGFVKKREKTTPSTGISGEALIRTGQNDILKALDGLVPGYQMVNGSPVIRGINSVTLSTVPLFEVDGVIVNSLDYINLYDVDHVEVLKDGSMYGSRGANGVIIVKTKGSAERH